MMHSLDSKIYIILNLYHIFLAPLIYLAQSDAKGKKVGKICSKKCPHLLIISCIGYFHAH
jgi:hypothetical protein